jgi:hypothetical protein
MDRYLRTRFLNVDPAFRVLANEKPDRTETELTRTRTGSDHGTLTLLLLALLGLAYFALFLTF